MFLVGGGILTHGFSWIDRWVKGIATGRPGLSFIESVLAAMTPMLANLVVGIVAGALAVAIVGGVRKLWPGKQSRPEADPRSP
jgi:predicted DNA repair protein MutK